MVDGEDYIYYKGVRNISRFGEEVREERMGEKKKEVLVLFKRKERFIVC